MPWPWALTKSCLDLQTGTVINWPWPTADYTRNAYAIATMLEVWRVWQLFYKPKTRYGAKGQMKNNWTPADVDKFAWLQENAWE